MAQGKRKKGPGRGERGMGSCYFDEARGLYVAQSSRTSGGVRERATGYGPTRARARADLAAKLAAKGAAPAGGAATAAELIAAWLAAGRADLAPSTRRNRDAGARSASALDLARRPAAGLTPADLEDARRELSASLTPSAAHFAWRALSAALRRAVARGLLAADPSAGVARPPEPAADAACLSREAAAAVLAAAAGRRIYPLVALALGSGARLGELLALRRCDAAGGVLAVERGSTEVAGARAVGPLKTRWSRRRVALPGWAAAPLAALPAGDPGSLLFAGPGGLPLWRSTVRMRFAAVLKAARKACRLPERVRFHDLRHTHASLLLSAGASVVAVSRRLGHKDPSITLKIYSHCMPGDDEKLAELAGGMF